MGLLKQLSLGTHPSPSHLSFSKARGRRSNGICSQAFVHQHQKTREGGLANFTCGLLTGPQKLQFMMLGKLVNWSFFTKAHQREIVSYFEFKSVISTHDIHFTSRTLLQITEWEGIDKSLRKKKMATSAGRSALPRLDALANDVWVGLR